MYKLQNDVKWKYLRIEMIFLLIFYYLFPILTDVEYSYNEMHNIFFFTKSLDLDFVYGTSNLISGIVYYYILKRYLRNSNTAVFLLCLSVFVVCLHYYVKATYLIVSDISWLPAKMRNDALSWSASNVIHFSVIYLCRDFLCLGALAFFIHSTEQGEQMRKLKEQQLMTELNYLKAQLHPHFFFNTMNNIYSLAQKKSEDTAPLVAKLADMMRYILYEADHETVPLVNDVKFFSDFIDAEKFRHHDGNEITFDIQGIESGSIIEPLLFLPFIENAFKHGLQQETASGFVHVVIYQNNLDLQLLVRNSKPVVKSPHRTGIGQINAIKRLDLLYANNYELKINDTPEIYELNLSLKCK